MSPRKKPRPISANQLVAANLRRARAARGLTQEEAAGMLEPYVGKKWSKAVFSAAETSTRTERIREFSANEILAFARAFDVSVSFFFLPLDELPPVHCGGPETIDAGALLDAAQPYKPNRLLTERVEEIAAQLPPALLNETEHRLRRTTHERVGAAMTDVFGAVDEDIAGLRRVADALERVKHRALIDTVESTPKEEGKNDG